jgi:integrase
MAQRRDKGGGTVYEEKLGGVLTGRWIGQLDLGKDATGKRRRRKFVASKRAEVVKAMRDAKRTLEDGNTLGKATDTMEALLRDFLTKGLPSTAKAPKTIEGYRWAIEDHLIPTLGGRRVRMLSVDDVDDMLRDKATGDPDNDVRPLSRATLVHIHGVLKRALRWGQKRGRVARNVAELADTPQGTRREGKSLTVEQALELAKLAQTERFVNGHVWREPLEALYLLGIAVPCRPGELSGLAWSSIDFENGVVHFRQALHHAVDGSLYLGPLKTEQSRRSVEVPAFVMDALRRRRVTQAADKLKLPAGQRWGAGWSTERTQSGLDSDLVFTTVAGGPLDLSNIRRSFNRLLKRAGVPGNWTTYELRHSSVSILSRLGVALEQISDMSGHKNSIVTGKIYRKQIQPVVTHGSGVMQALFGTSGGEQTG